MKLALVVLGAMFAAGCDLLFDIHRIDPTTGDAAIDHDGHAFDAHIADADTTICGMHDEDDDGTFDKCDRCPTISDPGDGDADGDGVGDLCDPDAGRHNTIDAFYSFQNGTGVSGTGDSYPNDTLKLADNGNVVSVRQFAAPEVINISITTLNTGGTTFQILVNPGGAGWLSCQLGTLCANSMPTCLGLYDMTGELDEVDMWIPAAAASSLVMYRDGNGVVHCSLNDLAPSHTVTSVGAVMPSGKIELQSINGATTLANAIVYNVQ